MRQGADGLAKRISSISSWLLSMAAPEDPREDMPAAIM